MNPKIEALIVSKRKTDFCESQKNEKYSLLKELKVRVEKIISLDKQNCKLLKRN